MHGLTSKIALLGVTLAFATGCPPERPDVEPNGPGIQRLAVLASSASGQTDIVILNASGSEVDRIDTGLSSWATGLAYHPDGYFLVGDSNTVYAIELDGDSSVFGDIPGWGGIHGITANDEGDVTVGNAEDGVTKFDEEGEVILHSTMSGTCFMDVAPIPGERGLDASIDIYGPAIVSADSETGDLDVIADGFTEEVGIVAVDGSGRFYAGSYWGNSLWTAEQDGEAARLGSLNELGLDSSGYIVAMTEASYNSVYVLFEASVGTTVAEIDSSGRVLDTLDAGSEIWTALVTF